MDHVRRVLHGGNLFGTFLIERDFELLFERHHDFDGVQGIRAEVDELGVGGDGVEIRAELFGDDRANLVEGIRGLCGGGDACETRNTQSVALHMRTNAVHHHHTRA